MIFGCGYLGEVLASRCLAKGWRVSALTRNPSTAESLRESGVHEVIEAQLHEDDWHSLLHPSFDFVVNCVGAASRSPEGYRQSYLAGQESICRWLEGGRTETLLFTSSVSVYPQGGGVLVDESSGTEGVSERGSILLDAENKCMSPTEHAGRSFVLRLAGLYGPGRHLLVEKLKKGEPFDGNSSRTLNLIHVEDAASATLSCLESPQGLSGGIYNVSDGSHFSRGEIVHWLAGRLDVDIPPFLESDGRRVADRKISIRKIQENLNWKPRYNSFVKGYDSILS